MIFKPPRNALDKHVILSLFPVDVTFEEHILRTEDKVWKALTIPPSKAEPSALYIVITQ